MLTFLFPSWTKLITPKQILNNFTIFTNCYGIIKKLYAYSQWAVKIQWTHTDGKHCQTLSIKASYMNGEWALSNLIGQKGATKCS